MSLRPSAGQTQIATKEQFATKELSSSGQPGRRAAGALPGLTTCPKRLVRIFRMRWHRHRMLLDLLLQVEIAASSWPSFPRKVAWGRLSTTTSGSTPWFSINDLPSGPYTPVSAAVAIPPSTRTLSEESQISPPQVRVPNTFPRFSS